MNEFYLCHVALVGARISAFKQYGYTTRNDLSLCRVVPTVGPVSFAHKPRHEARAMLTAQFPIWIHNIITDPEFPQRDTLLMPLRRFEGELNDSKDNEVISAVLSAGFKSRTLDPRALPDSMPLRQRCVMLVNIDTWQDAYLCLEKDVVEIIMGRLPELDNWIKLAEGPEQEIIEYFGKSA